MWSAGKGNGKPLQDACLENPINSIFTKGILAGISLDDGSLMFLFYVSFIHFLQSTFTVFVIKTTKIVCKRLRYIHILKLC